MPRSAAALHGLGIPHDRLLRLADALGMACRQPAGGDERVVLLFDGHTTAEDPDLWVRPFAAWIETGTRSDAALAASVARAADAGADLYASVTTGTANHLHLAGRIVAALASRHALTDVQRDDMELALHEAVSNAVVHGNLQVDGMKGLSVAALDRFSHELATRIADPAFAGRLVEVIARLEPHAVVVEVADEGNGFAKAASSRSSGPAPSGRGLDLICAIAECVELLDEGRRIRMRFAL